MQTRTASTTKKTTSKSAAASKLASSSSSPRAKSAAASKLGSSAKKSASTKSGAAKKPATAKPAAASKLASNATSARAKSAAAKKLGSSSKNSSAAGKSASMSTGTAAHKGILTEQERITDLMFAEKKMQANYCSFASECVSTKLRDEFLKLQSKSHMTQYDLFSQAQTRGWYKPKAAQATAVKQAYTKFSSMNQL